MADAQREQISQFREEGKREAEAVKAEDTGHWTPSAHFTCPRGCKGNQCLYIQTFKGGHGYDDNNIEPAITIRCKDCRHLWKEDEVEGGARLAAGSEQSTVAGELLASSDKKPEIWRETNDRKTP